METADPLRSYLAAVIDGGALPTQAQWERIAALCARPASSVSSRREYADGSHAEWLKAELAKPGRSQAELARRMGVHQATVNRFALGKSRIRADDLQRIKAYLAETDHEA